MEYSFKGTQGKWSQSHRKLQDGGYSTQVYCEKGKTIATLDWYPSELQERLIKGVKVTTQGTDREANALLISKAPEMLFLLKDLLMDKGLNDVSRREVELLIKQATEL